MTIEEYSRTFRKSGTTEYIAPEVIDGSFLSPKSDVFCVETSLHFLFQCEEQLQFQPPTFL